MDLVGLMQISASGLSAQQVRLEVVAANIANANTTRSAEGGPYVRKEPVFQAVDLPGGAFSDRLRRHLQQVIVQDIQNDPTGPRRVHDPGHPDADAEGFVELPNVDVMREMVDMVSASRSYEANVTALSATKAMAIKAFEIGK